MQWQRCFQLHAAGLLWHAVLCNALLLLLRRLPTSVKAFVCYRLGSAVCNITGSVVISDGWCLPRSFSNMVSDVFAPPLDPADFPFGDDALISQPSPHLLHLLSLASALASESLAVIQDTVNHRWGLNFEDGKAVYLPAQQPPQALARAEPVQQQALWYAFSNKHAVVVAFRGGWSADLLWLGQPPKGHELVNLLQNDLGRVQDCYFQTLFHLPPVPSAEGCAFDEILALLSRQAFKHKHIYLTGHGCGGALASVFASALHAKRPTLSDMVAGVHMFGGPKVGDAKYAELFEQQYRCRSWRHVMDHDVFAKLPLGSEWCHHSALHRVSSMAGGTFQPGLNCRLAVTQPDPQAQAVSTATPPRLASIGAVRANMTVVNNGWAPLLLTIASWLAPDLRSHLPSEYEACLRIAAQQHAAEQQLKSRSNLSSDMDVAEPQTPPRQSPCGGGMPDTAPDIPAWPEHGERCNATAPLERLSASATAMPASAMHATIVGAWDGHDSPFSTQCGACETAAWTNCGRPFTAQHGHQQMQVVACQDGQGRQLAHSPSAESLPEAHHANGNSDSACQDCTWGESSPRDAAGPRHHRCMHLGVDSESDTEWPDASIKWQSPGKLTSSLDKQPATVSHNRMTKHVEPVDTRHSNPGSSEANAQSIASPHMHALQLFGTQMDELAETASCSVFVQQGWERPAATLAASVASGFSPSTSERKQARPRFMSRDDMQVLQLEAPDH